MGIGISYVTSGALDSLFAIYSVLASFHLFASFKALSNVELNTFNRQRVHLILEKYFEDDAAKRRILKPNEIKERMFLPPKYWQEEPQIILGASLREAFRDDMSSLCGVLDIFGSQKYLLNYNQKEKKIFVVLEEAATPMDILQSYFNANHLRCLLVKEKENDFAMQHKQMSEQFKHSLDFTVRHYADFISNAEKQGWVTHVLLVPKKNRAKWITEVSVIDP